MPVTSSRAYVGTQSESGLWEIETYVSPMVKTGPNGAAAEQPESGRTQTAQDASCGGACAYLWQFSFTPTSSTSAWPTSADDIVGAAVAGGHRIRRLRVGAVGVVPAQHKRQTAGTLDS